MQHAIRAREQDSLAAGLSVLLVDDDPDDRLLISDLLESTPSIDVVESVASFAEARAAIFERRHHVYLVDYRLGAHDGLELITEVGGRACGPFIILTGMSDPAVDRRAAEVGAYDYLDKDTLDVEVLARSIRYSTTLWRANDRLARRSDRQTALASLSRHAVDVVDLASFLPVALDVVIETLGADCGAISAFDQDAATPVVSTGPCARMTVSGVATELGVQTSVSRVIADGRPWGTLDVHTHGSGTFEPDDVTFIDAVTNLIAAVFDRAEAGTTRDRLAEILEASPDVAGTVDLDGVVSYLNRAGRELFGVGDGGAPPGARYDDFQPPWAAELLRSTAFPQAMSLGWWSGRSALVDKEGHEIPVSQVVIVHRNAQGEATHFSTVAHDLTRDLAAEKALSDSRALLTKAFHESPIGKVIISVDDGIVSANHAFEQLIGCRPGSLPGRDTATLVHPDDLEWLRAEIQSVLSGESSRLAGEVRLLVDDGSERWVFATISVIYGSRGEPEHIVVQIQDVHSEKLAGERIAFQASLLDQVHNAVIATDLMGRVTYWNRSAEEMLGWAAEEVLGESVFDLVIPETDRAIETAALVSRSLAETGIWQGEGVLKRKDGSTFVASMTDSMLLDDSGAPVGIVGIKADVTRLRQMESEARRSETIAASVLRSVHFPVAVLDPKGTVVEVNRAWTQFAIDNGGDPGTTGIGANYLDVCRGAGDAAGASEALLGIESVLQGRRGSFTLEYECSAPGDERWFEMEVQPIPGEGAVVVHWNVTAERLHRMALQETIDAKDRFIASISHELRTPLTAVVGLAEELRAGNVGDEEAREFQVLIADQARELSLLVDDLLIAARLDSDTLTLRPGVVHLRREVDHVLAPWLSESSREVSVFADPDAAAWADPGRVRQVLRNLVSNAIRYGADPIEVHVTAQDSQITVAVVDHGAGIPESARERMFQPYSTFAATEGLTASVGLGLHVSRDLALRMGGALDYRRQEGVTTFELILPAAFVTMREDALVIDQGDR